MKKFILLLLLLIPLKINAIETSARSAILMDIDTNRILYEKNIHEVRSVASISKIMTAVVVLENTDIKKQVVIGNEIDKAREFISFEIRNLWKPLKNGYFFVKFHFLLLRTIRTFDIIIL